MKHQKMRKWCTGTLACLMLANTIGSVPLQSQAAATTVIHNPLIWSDVPDNDVIRVGDTYYMVSTTMFFSPGAPIMKSKDLVSWEICSYVYDTYADGDVQNLTGGKHDYAHGQWATSLRYHDGVFYVFFGSYGSGKSYIYKTTDIEHGTWTRSELNGMYHDASMLFDDDGRNYLVFGGGGEIKIKELNAEMTDFKWGGVEQTLFKTGLDGLSGEGSHIQKIGDYYYIFLIAWPSGSGRIELCYRSKTLLGTYEGKTVLNSGLGTYGSGVAQGGIVDTPDGKWYAMLFQDHGAVGRIPSLIPVTWVNDWPTMGENGKAPVTLTVDGDYTGTSLAASDSFSYAENKLRLEWQWNHNPDNNAWSVTERDGYLRLHNEHIATNLLNARNTLTMRTEGPSCSSSIKLETSGMKIGDYAGLSAFQFNYGNIGVMVKDDGSKAIYMAKNGGTEIANSSNQILAETPLSNDTVYLKVDFRFNTVDANFNSSNNIDRANFFYSYDGSNWTKLGEELRMTYDLKLFTGYRSAIYSYPTKTTGGYADIDAFTYEREAWNAPTVIEPDENGWFFHHTYENGSESWSGRGAASVSYSAEQAYMGNQSLAVQGRTAAWNGATLPLSSAAFKPGDTFSFSANVCYLEGGDFDTFYMKLQYVDGTGETQYATVAEGLAPKGKWVQLANSDYTIPADATDLYLYIETADSTNSFYVDEAIGALGGIGILGAGSYQPDYLLGDVDENGVINGIDLTLAKRLQITRDFVSPVQQLAVDVNQDGILSLEDVEMLRDFLIGKVTAFTPAELPE